jgi:hypothetical protein
MAQNFFKVWRNQRDLLQEEKLQKERVYDEKIKTLYFLN